jgi:hypothetical protein
MVIPLDASPAARVAIMTGSTFDTSACNVTWLILDELVIQVVIPLTRFVSIGG